tara:strand:- start:5106 stop:6128 length:1023 start_codon:yes stop_codon:yes gene_type:complete
MSFWTNNHPTLQDKYDILWKRYVPSCGRCYKDEAEALRLVSGVGYQLYNNGCWFGTGNYHVKEYMSQNICSAADDFMHMLDYLYKQSDEYLEDHAWNDLTDEEKEQRVEEAMEWVVEAAWLHLADETDKKELAKRERKKNAEKRKIAAAAKKEERATKKRKREAARVEQQEEKKLRKLYKIHAGKRFRRKKGSSVSALEQLRNTRVQLGLTGMHALSEVGNIMKKAVPAEPEVSPSPLVDVTKLSPEMAKYAEFMIPDPEIDAPPSQKPIQKHNNSVTPEVASPVKTNKFTPTVSEMEFLEYQTWQRWGRGPLPSWFMTDDTKARDIMSHYKQVEQYYNH